MRKWLKNNKKPVAIIHLILLAFLAMLLLFRSDLLNQPNKYPLYELDDGWQIYLNGELLDASTLSRFETRSVHYSDVYELKRTLPEEEFPGAALSFYGLQAVIKVDVDGREVFSYGEERYRTHSMLKRGYCLATLPSGYTGKELTLTFIASEPFAFNGLGPVWFGNETELFRSFLEARRVPLFFGLFLCLYALFQILCLPFLFSETKRLVTPLLGSVLSLNMGLYILGFYYLFGLIARQQDFNTILEYGSLYFLPVTISAYLYSLLDGLLKRIYLLFVEVGTLLIIAIFTLHMINSVHITSFLPVFYILSMAESLPYLLSVRRLIQKQQEFMPDPLHFTSRVVVYFGFAVYLVGSFLDIVGFAYAKYFGGAEGDKGILFFTIGAMVFTLSVTMQYFMQGIAHLQSDTTRSLLEERAYTDVLTGLANRTRCELEIQQMSVADPFVIISLDIDNLKTVNDTYGHAEGDRLLATFAEVLKRCFGDAHLVGRMGGDEFIVILTGSQRTLVDAKLKEMQRELFELNAKENAFRYEVSFGYADNRETHLGRHVRDIYMLADRRMYDSKRRKAQGEWIDD